MILRKPGPNAYDLFYALMTCSNLCIATEDKILRVYVGEIGRDSKESITFAGFTTDGIPYQARVNINQHSDNFGSGELKEI